MRVIRENPGIFTEGSCYLQWIGAQFGMSAISSPAAIGHDWSSACPAENKIPDEWLPDNSDPDTSDASVIQGKVNFPGRYQYSALPRNDSISYGAQIKKNKNIASISSNNSPIFLKYFNHHGIKNEIPNIQNYPSLSYFTTNRYLWMPVQRHPIIMYPMLNIPQYTFG